MQIRIAALFSHVAAVSCLAACGAAMSYAVSLKTSADTESALTAYRAKAHLEAESVGKTTAAAFDQIYQNLRTISLLASVRRIDRHAVTLSTDGRQAIQQIFNNLASNIAVSEVYIVPESLDPDQRDPKTGENQVPILMVDKVRLGIDTAEPEDAVDPNDPVQEESFEYHALRSLMTVLRTAAPTMSKKGDEIPFFSIPALITCDNSVFNKTRVDADRTGPIYSVPFYGEDDKLKGTISAIMLSSAVENFFPAENYALVDTSNHDIFASGKDGQQIASAQQVAELQPDTDLFYSEVVALKTKDPRKAFALWAGRPRSEFLASADLAQVERFRFLGYSGAAAFVVLGLALWLMIRRASRKTAEAEAYLQARLEMRTVEIREMVEAQAKSREAAEAARQREEAEVAATRAQSAVDQAQVVDSLAAGLSKLASGDLSHRIAKPFTQEYERLRVDFNQAIEKLCGSMGTVSENSVAIRGGTAAIAKSVGDLSSRTLEQVASLEETVAAVDTITSTVRRTADGAMRASLTVRKTKSDAERSGEIVAQAVAAMVAIEQSSKQIGQIIGAIDEIAFQTNLLALNAGVEAARAGDSGRGFAVVASEVRALAQKSAEAAKQIKTLVTTSSQQVDAGANLVNAAGESLQRIVAQVAEITDAVAEMATAAKEQANGLNEVNAGINLVDKNVQQNSAMAQDCAAATRLLSQQTTELVNLTARFDLGDRSDAGAERRRAAA